MIERRWRLNRPGGIDLSLLLARLDVQREQPGLIGEPDVSDATSHNRGGRPRLFVIELSALLATVEFQCYQSSHGRNQCRAGPTTGRADGLGISAVNRSVTPFRGGAASGFDAEKPRSYAGMDHSAHSSVPAVNFESENAPQPAIPFTLAVPTVVRKRRLEGSTQAYWN